MAEGQCGRRWGWTARLGGAVVVVATVAALALAVVAAGSGPAAAAPGGPATCALTLSPPSGPVGTLVSVRGSTAGCPQIGTERGFGFTDGPAGIWIGVLPVAGPFAFQFRIPVTVAAGGWSAPPTGPAEPAGRLAVGAGPAVFADRDHSLSTSFEVTPAPSGWADYTSIVAAGLGSGSRAFYSLVRSDGLLATFGARRPVGDAGSVALRAPIVAAALTPDTQGYWLAAADGGVFTFGDAGFHGSVAGVALAAPVSGMATTPSGNGYWLVGQDGGVFTFGDAGFYGSLPGRHVTPDQPIVGIAATPDGRGYWLVGADGGVFTFGDAAFYGSAAPDGLHAPVVGMARTPDGGGYWLVGRDGGVFTFGDATFAGSAASRHLRFPAVAITPSRDGRGYWILGQNGTVLPFGDAPYYGSGKGQLHPEAAPSG